jgi:peptide/nickel transport system substrate-binding protein
MKKIEKTGGFHKIMAVALSAVLLASLLAGCGGGGGGGGDSSAGDAGEGAVSDTLTIGLGQEIVSLDSAFAYDFQTNPIVTNITEGLLILNEEGQPEPFLAESWEIVDPLTYVYNIRSDVKFSDGNPMTMEDVIFSLERYSDPDLASYLGWMYDNVDTIEQTGDWQITVRLSAPDAFWQYVFSTTAGHIHEKAVVEAAIDVYGGVSDTVIGTGPYPIESWDAGGNITLQYNPDYWDSSLAEPDIKTIVVLHIPEDATRSLAAQSGQIDVDFSTPADLAPEIQANENVDLLQVPSLGITFVGFNCQKPPFDDPNARRAVASAIDIATWQESVIKDEGRLTKYMMVPDSLFLFDEERWNTYESEVPKYEYNIEKAKEYLAQSRYPDGFDCVLLVDDYTISNNLALALQQSLKEVNINVTIDKQSNEEVTSQQFGSGMQDGLRPYEFGLFSWVSDFPDPAGVLNPLLTSGSTGDGGSNTAEYVNAEVDRLLQQQLESTDSAERTSLMMEALDIVSDEQPYYVLYQSNWQFTVSKRIQNPEKWFHPSYFWNFCVKNMEIGS